MREGRKEEVKQWSWVYPKVSLKGCICFCFWLKEPPTKKKKKILWVPTNLWKRKQISSIHAPSKHQLSWCSHHTSPLCQGDGLGSLGFHGNSWQGHPHKSYSNYFSLLVSASQACHIWQRLCPMVGSGLAVIQATEASRNTTFARQMIPEARAFRAPLHCSQRVSPRPRQDKNSIYSPRTMSTVYLTCASHCAVSWTNTASLPRSDRKGGGTRCPQK